MNKERSVLLEHAYLLAHGLVNYGFTFEASCRKLSLPPPAQLAKGSRLSVERFVELLDVCEAASEDPLFALRTSFSASPSSMQLASSLALNANNVREAFDVYLEFQHIFNDAIQASVDVDDEWVLLKHTLDHDGFSDEDAASMMELRVGFLCRTLKNIIGIPLKQSVGQVYFTHLPRTEVGDYCEIIGSIPVFGAEFCGGRIPRDVYEMPTISPDRELMAIAKQKVTAAQNAKLPETGALAPLIKNLLPGMLTSTDPLQQNVAKALNTSVSTLRRRLSAEGVSFQQLLNEVRIEQAKLMLLREQKSISEVAHATGFSETSTLTTMFKRFTGLTPSQYRKENV